MLLRAPWIDAAHSQQFHWENNGFTDFDAFCTRFPAVKAQDDPQGTPCGAGFWRQILSLSGDQIKPHHWDAFWRFYQDTGRAKMGYTLSDPEFFHIAQETMRDNILLVLAERDGRYIAGALNFIGGDTLFGPYWAVLRITLACILSCATTARLILR